MSELPKLRDFGAPIIPNRDFLIPGKSGILPNEQSEYSLSVEGHKGLTSYVDRIKRQPPGKLVETIDFDVRRPLIDRHRLRDNLPAGLSEADFYEGLYMAGAIEAGVKAYGQVIGKSGELYDAPWMVVYAEDIWIPDEQKHEQPFELALVQAGYSYAELQSAFEEIRSRVYYHTSGDTPVHMSMFGVIQEEVTDVWHGLFADILEGPKGREIAPDLAALIRSVKKRESLHKMWYRDMTAAQITDNPRLRDFAADAIARFKFPGEVLVPNLFEGSVDKIPLLGRDLKVLERDLVRLISSSLVNKPEYLGEAIIDVLNKRAEDFGIPFTNLLRFTSRIPGLGYMVNRFTGLVIYEREGIKPKDLESKGAVETAVWNITQPLRSLIVNHLEERQFIAT